jgi:urease accessory protein
MIPNNLALLALLQLADSALPIGTTAHSFGLETLVEIGLLDVAGLEEFLRALLVETGLLECFFCLAGQRLARLCTDDRADAAIYLPQWLQFNARLSAFKMARESRQASSTLGRRFLQLAIGLEIHPILPVLLEAARSANVEVHHCTAFGLVGGLVGSSEQQTGLAFLQQMLAGLVSACQRLLPLGQSQASQILWRLHAAIVTTVERAMAATQTHEVACFAAVPDLGSMRHPMLTTRLFIS